MRLAISSRPVVESRSSSAARRSYASWVRNVTGASLDTCVSFGAARASSGRGSMSKRPGSGQGVYRLCQVRLRHPAGVDQTCRGLGGGRESTRGRRARAGPMRGIRRPSSRRRRAPRPAPRARTRPCARSGAVIWNASVTVRASSTSNPVVSTSTSSSELATVIHANRPTSDRRATATMTADRPAPAGRAARGRIARRACPVWSSGPVGRRRGSPSGD